MLEFYVNSVMSTSLTGSKDAFIILHDLSRCRGLDARSALNVAFARKLAKATKGVNQIYDTVKFVQLYNSDFIIFLFSSIRFSGSHNPPYSAA